jgi:hypothetical protein
VLRVYLDQNKWLDLAWAAKGDPRGDRYADVLAAARACCGSRAPGDRAGTDPRAGHSDSSPGQEVAARRAPVDGSCQSAVRRVVLGL